MLKVVVVMPTYKEAENIGPMIEELVGKEFPKIEKADMHLLVVDANSPDGTGEVVKEKMKKYDKVHLLSKEKGGLGADYVAGFKYAMKELKADATMEMDADFQHNPKHVKDMVAAFLDGADYVIGSRYIPGGSIPAGWPWYRKALSYFGNLYARLVLWLPKIHDLTTGFRLTRVRGVLEKIDLDNIMELKRFAHKTDLLFKTVKLSKKTVEVPIQFAVRKKEASKFNLQEMLASYKVVMLLRIKESQRFIKFGIVGFTGYLVNALGLWFFAKAGFPEWAIWATATELAIISNFIFNNIWTFKKEKITGVGKIVYKFFQFNLTSAGALIIQTVFGTLGVHLFGPQYRQLLLPFIILFMVLPYNYFMYNAVIWKTWKLPWSKAKKKA